jgi:class 3 adenylate cyclase
MNYTAIGDDVNIAFRLEETCPGGKIYVSDPVYQKVRRGAREPPRQAREGEPAAT